MVVSSEDSSLLNSYFTRSLKTKAGRLDLRDPRSAADDETSVVASRTASNVVEAGLELKEVEVVVLPVVEMTGWVVVADK